MIEESIQFENIFKILIAFIAFAAAAIILVQVPFILFNLMKERAEKQKAIARIKPGVQFIVNNDNSPWPRNTLTVWTVTVIDFKDGWVRYKFDRKNCLFQDERMRVDMFIRIYTPIRKES